MLLPGPADGGYRLFLADRQAAGATRLQDTEGDRRYFERLDRIAQRRRRIGPDRHDLAKFEGAEHIVPAFRLDRDDFCIRAGKRDPRGQTAAAAIDKDLGGGCGSGLVKLCEDFQPDGSLPGDDVWVVVA